MTEPEHGEYQEILDKMMEDQRHMFHYLTVVKDNGYAPESLLHGMAAAQEWKDVMDGREGLSDAPNLRDAEEFNKALQENKPMFPEREVRLADEYDSLLHELEKVWDHPLNS